MVAKVLGMAAERLGFEVAMASDATDFLQRAIDWSPSHVAIDLTMPRMGGVLVLDRLGEAGCNARVIIASGADASQVDAALDHARARGLAVAGALSKPFKMGTLRELLGC
jgi:CheY-like chemotaxis protein